MTSSIHPYLKVLIFTLLLGVFLSLGSVAHAQEFVPLTQLPGLEFSDDSDTLPQFLNQLYRISIGVAAVLAVLMIMRAGAEIMVSQGSVMSNEKAKDRIKNAILGLVLVLSPVVVFTVINPQILKLEFDFSKLQPTNSGPVADEDNTFKFAGRDTVLWAVESTNKAVDARRCSLSNGTIHYVCVKKASDTSKREIGASETCNSDENYYLTCSSKAAQPSTLQQCKAEYDPIIAVGMNPAPNVCNASEGFVPVVHGCCAGAEKYGNLCCAKPKNPSQ